MSSTSKPRITKRTAPAKPIKRHKYRATLPNLLSDFDSRCAYSLQHVERAGGLKCMEVDHFDPSKKKDLIQEYDNLLPSTRHCNGQKGDYWPTKEDQRLGVRFLNPRIEEDYGPHIVENVATGLLVGVTPAGRWQIRMCGLNASHLVSERKNRTKHLNSLSKARPIKIAGSLEAVSNIIEGLREELNLMIPQLPAFKDTGKS